MRIAIAAVKEKTFQSGQLPRAAQNIFWPKNTSRKIYSRKIRLFVKSNAVALETAFY